MTSRNSRVRWQVVAALFLLSFLTIVDRVCISAAKGDMSRDLGLSDVTFGWVFGVFALGYAIFQVPSGWLADSYGPRKFLTAIVLLWSLFTGLTGLVYGSVALIAVRFLFGLAEAGAYPGSQPGFLQLASHAGTRCGAGRSCSRVPGWERRSVWRSCPFRWGGWDGGLSFCLLCVAGVAWARVLVLVVPRLSRMEKKGVSEGELSKSASAGQARQSPQRHGRLAGMLLLPQCSLAAGAVFRLQLHVLPVLQLAAAVPEESVRA